jgi:hypothetical protein
MAGEWSWFRVKTLNPKPCALCSGLPLPPSPSSSRLMSTFSKCGTGLGSLVASPQVVSAVPRAGVQSEGQMVVNDAALPPLLSVINQDSNSR